MENSFKIDGEILYIDKQRPAKEGSTFMLRDFAIEQVVAGEGNYIKFQLKGTNTPKIDGFLPGDKVDVSFSVLGSNKIKEDKVSCDTNPRKIDAFSNLNAWKIEYASGYNPALNPLRMSTNLGNPNISYTTPTTQPQTNPIPIDDLPF